jgi:hypothetical protein
LSVDVDASADPVSLDDAPDPDRERARLADERSFLAQPEPLKCTVGDVRALCIVPSAPHAGQNRGPGAWMPWMTSVRCRQAVQT